MTFFNKQKNLVLTIREDFIVKYFLPFKVDNFYKYNYHSRLKYKPAFTLRMHEDFRRVHYLKLNSYVVSRTSLLLNIYLGLKEYYSFTNRKNNKKLIEKRKKLNKLYLNDYLDLFILENSLFFSYFHSSLVTNKIVFYFKNKYNQFYFIVKMVQIISKLNRILLIQKLFLFHSTKHITTFKKFKLEKLINIIDEKMLKIKDILDIKYNINFYKDNIKQRYFFLNNKISQKFYFIKSRKLRNQYFYLGFKNFFLSICDNFVSDKHHKIYRKLNVIDIMLKKYKLVLLKKRNIFLFSNWIRVFSSLFVSTIKNYILYNKYNFSYLKYYLKGIFYKLFHGFSNINKFIHFSLYINIYLKFSKKYLKNTLKNYKQISLQKYGLILFYYSIWKYYLDMYNNIIFFLTNIIKHYYSFFQYRYNNIFNQKLFFNFINVTNIFIIISYLYKSNLHFFYNKKKYRILLTKPVQKLSILKYNLKLNRFYLLKKSKYFGLSKLRSIASKLLNYSQARFLFRSYFRKKRSRIRYIIDKLNKICDSKIKYLSDQINNNYRLFDFNSKFISFINTYRQRRLDKLFPKVEKYKFVYGHTLKRYFKFYINVFRHLTFHYLRNTRINNLSRASKYLNLAKDPFFFCYFYSFLVEEKKMIYDFHYENINLNKSSNKLLNNLLVEYKLSILKRDKKYSKFFSFSDKYAHLNLINELNIEEVEQDILFNKNNKKFIANSIIGLHYPSSYYNKLKKRKKFFNKINHNYKKNKKIKKFINTKTVNNKKYIKQNKFNNKHKI